MNQPRQQQPSTSARRQRRTPANSLWLDLPILTDIVEEPDDARPAAPSPRRPRNHEPRRR